MGGISKLRYLSEGDFLDNVRIASAFIIQEICYLPATLQVILIISFHCLEERKLMSSLLLLLF